MTILTGMTMTTLTSCECELAGACDDSMTHRVPTLEDARHRMFLGADPPSSFLAHLFLLLLLLHLRHPIDLCYCCETRPARSNPETGLEWGEFSD
jgi:hypothetical protein